MSVERRRNIALIGVAVIAIGTGAYLGRESGGEEAGVRVPTPAPVAAVPAAPSLQDPMPTAPAPQQDARAEVPSEPVPEPAPETVVEAVREEAEEVDLAAVEPVVEPEAIAPDVAAPEIAAPEIIVPQVEATFDIVRVEPTGDAVIAGRAGPGATVELLRDGEVHAVEVADASGGFVFIAPPLPPGAHEIALQVRGDDGAARRSRQSVTVVIAEGRDETPMVALVEPDRPTVVLSRPEPAQPPVDVAAAESVEAEAEEIETAEVEAAEGDVAEVQAQPPREEEIPVAEAPAPTIEETPTRLALADAAGEIATRAGVRIASVEAETDGGLYVSGNAASRARVRLYLNETLVGTAFADETGSVSFAIRRGVRAGDYRVRLDDIDPRDGSVLSRAQVLFAMPTLVAQAAPEPAPEPEPEPAAETGAEPSSDVALGPDEAPGSDEELGDAAAAVEAVEERVERAATLTIPEVNTAIVARGDSLWRISRRIYGRGVRYTVIYDANAEQIRNPDLIFPGQVFVLPAAEEEPAAAEGGDQRETSR